jgi:hypothetical protein
VYAILQKCTGDFLSSLFVLEIDAERGQVMKTVTFGIDCTTERKRQRRNKHIDNQLKKREGKTKPTNDLEIKVGQGKRWQGG